MIQGQILFRGFPRVDAEKPPELLRRLVFPRDVVGASLVNGLDFKSPDGPIVR